jgi:hypothetical protein
MQINGVDGQRQSILVPIQTDAEAWRILVRERTQEEILELITGFYGGMES